MVNFNQKYLLFEVEFFFYLFPLFHESVFATNSAYVSSSGLLPFDRLVHTSAYLVQMVTLFRQNISQYISTSVVALPCAVGIVALQVPQLNRLTDKVKTISVTNLKKELDAEKVRLNILHKSPSFSFDNLVADWTLINFLVVLKM